MAPSKPSRPPSPPALQLPCATPGPKSLKPLDRPDGTTLEELRFCASFRRSSLPVHLRDRFSPFRSSTNCPDEERMRRVFMGCAWVIQDQLATENRFARRSGGEGTLARKIRSSSGNPPPVCIQLLQALQFNHPHSACQSAIHRTSVKPNSTLRALLPVVGSSLLASSPHHSKPCGPWTTLRKRPSGFKQKSHDHTL